MPGTSPLDVAGTLYVVATPIGNLGDVSPRAIEVLGSVDVVACEDTRVTAKLLRRYDVRTATLSYHEHNEAERAEQLVDRLRRGDSVALVSDAGTPTLSDPGYRLVRAAVHAKIPVRAVPGPSALLAALSVSGLPSSSFTFIGFLPSKGSRRRKAIEDLAAERHTIVLFESAPRVPSLLVELARILGERPACLLRELTKLHEEHRHGSLGELASWARSGAPTGKTGNIKGELTLVIGPRTSGAARATPDAVEARFRELIRDGLTRRAAVKSIAKENRLPARQVYDAVLGVAEGGSERED